MIQIYSIISIIGFSLASVFLVTAIVLFFTLHIKQVRNDLTGKTAFRAISEIRARTQSRKRSASGVAKQLGWERDISSGDIAEFAADEGRRITAQIGVADEDDCATSYLISSEDDVEEECATAIFDRSEKHEQ